MAHIISIFNQKGGCGKTTSAVSICSCLSIMYDGKKKILLIDADPSAGASGDIKHDEPETYYSELILDYCDDQSIVSPEIAISKTNIPSVDLMPANNKLGRAIKAINNYEYSNNRIFTQIFADLEDMYDFIIIDTIGSKHNTLSLNALVFSSWVLMQLEAEKKNEEGYAESLSMVNAVRREENPTLDVLGVFYTKVDERRSLDKFFISSGFELFDDAYIDIPIHEQAAVVRNASLIEEPIPFAAPKSRVGNDYNALTKEILRRLGEN